MGYDGYDELAREVADDAKREDLVLATDCNCAGPFVDGARPEHFKGLRKAVLAWASHAIYHRRYWGVHYRGQHLLHVKNHYRITALGGMAALEKQRKKE